MNIDKKYVAGILRKRAPETHKGNYGHLLIVAGSPEMTGAAVLCARGAFRSGAGLVYMCMPKEIFPVMQISVPEAICVDREKPLELGKYDAIAFGPGLGIHEENAVLLSRILQEYEGKLIIDADGLNNIARFDLFSQVRNAKADIAITPHTGEAARLADLNGLSREAAALKLSEKLGCVSVLKGNRTVVTDGEQVVINTSGNPGMAAAGSGDVLTGAVTSLCGQGYSCMEASACGVYLHGLAGDLAARELGQWGIMASDLANHLSFAIKNTIGE